MRGNSSDLSRSLVSSLSSSEDPEALLGRLMHDTNAYVGSHVGFIYLLDSEARSLTFQLGYNCDLQDVEHSVLSVEQSASGTVISRKEVVEFDDIQEPKQPYLCKEFARRNHLTSYLAAPLMDSHYQVMGVLGLHPNLGRSLRTSEREEVVGAARVIALAMEASRTREREQQVRRLARLGNMLTAGGDLRTVFIALEQIRTSVSVEAVYFFAADRPETEFIARGDSFPEIGSIHVRRLAQKYLDTHLPVIRQLPGKAPSSSSDYRSAVQVFVIASSVRCNDEVKGLLVFVDTFKPLPTRRMPALSKDGELIEVVSYLFGIFLENLDYLQSLHIEEQRREALTLSLAHEFLIPITGLASRIDRLKEVCLPHFPIRERSQPPALYFDDVSGALEDLRELTTGILSLTERQCSFKPVYLFKILVQVYDILKDQASRRHLTVHFSKQEFLSCVPQLQLDRALITHVFYNVLKNAIKYSFKRTPIEVKATQAGDCYAISFRNWGIGVPAGEAAKIFEPFQQGTNAHQVNVRGAGLGLNICKRIMELHSGRIVLERATSPTVFTLHFPSTR
jgi:signal transduction histidine kinase